MMKTPYQRHIADIDAIPAELRNLPIWCAWKLLQKPGKKPGKQPVSPINGATEGWTKPGFTTDALTAIQYAQGRAGLRGIGLLLGIEPNLAGGDLDHCRDPATGEPTDEALQIIQAADTYTEVSPGLRGYRFLFSGSFGGHTGIAGGIEFYEDSRFLTFTGEQIDGTPFAIERRDLTELGRKHFPNKGTTKTTGGAAPSDWQPVDLHALNLSGYTIKLIQTGGEGKDRSVSIFGVCKDLVRAGCDDATICRVLADPANGISAGALERRKGNVHSAMRWIAEHNIPNARKEVEAEPKVNLSGFKAGGTVDPETGEVTPPTFSLDRFALNGRSQEMRSKMLEDKHILGRVALLGQLTAFYTERNGGKTLLTLWLLIDAIKRGTISAGDVYYVNSDDTHKGLVEKTELAERHGFKMLADGYQGFKNDLLVDALKKLSDSGEARGKIVILDTLKKFTDLMHKKQSSDFMQALRAFVLQGGSVVMLAHVNKHRDEAGKLVFSGTTDVPDDADCAYIMDKITRDGKSIVTFDNIKARGDVAAKAVYSFERKPDGGQTYGDLLNTVQAESEDELKRAREAATVLATLEANHKVIAETLDAIREGITKRTELIAEVQERTGESKKRVIQVLDHHTGGNYLAGSRWSIAKGQKNAKIYQEVSLFSTPPQKTGAVSENWKS